MKLFGGEKFEVMMMKNVTAFTLISTTEMRAINFSRYKNIQRWEN